MEGVFALAGVLVGAGCTYIITLVRDKRIERARDAALVFELNRKLAELKLHVMEPQNFDIGFFSGSGIDEFMSRNWNVCSRQLLTDLSSWRQAVTEYLWYGSRKDASSPERQQQLVKELQQIITKFQ